MIIDKDKELRQLISSLRSQKKDAVKLHFDARTYLQLIEDQLHQAEVLLKERSLLNQQ